MGMVNRPTTARPGLTSKIDTGAGGLKAPSAVKGKEEQSKAGTSSTASTPLKRAPTTLKNSVTPTLKSADSD